MLIFIIVVAVIFLSVIGYICHAVCAKFKAKRKEDRKITHNSNAFAVDIIERLDSLKHKRPSPLGFLTKEEARVKQAEGMVEE